MKPSANADRPQGVLLLVVSIWNWMLLSFPDAHIGVSYYHAVTDTYYAITKSVAYSFEDFQRFDKEDNFYGFP